jgi:Flp pilus assembly pilin Flp
MISMSIRSIRRLTKRDDGQDLLEYGLLATLIAVFAVAAVRLVGNQISTVLWATIANNF